MTRCVHYEKALRGVKPLGESPKWLPLPVNKTLGVAQTHEGKTSPRPHPKSSPQPPQFWGGVPSPVGRFSRWTWEPETGCRSIARIHSLNSFHYVPVRHLPWTLPIILSPFKKKKKKLKEKRCYRLLLTFFSLINKKFLYFTLTRIYKNPLFFFAIFFKSINNKFNK